jgi:hypothetical protein
MGKVVQVAAAVVGVAAILIPGVGAAISAGILGALGGIGGSVLGISALSISLATFSALELYGLASAAKLVTGALGLGPKAPQVSQASIDRLNSSLDPRAFRKIVFGYTAAATDVHYQEFTAPAQDHLTSIITLASHAIESIEQVFFEEKLAYNSGAIGSDFSGYLTFIPITEGTPANAFTPSTSTSWTAAHSRMVGLAYLQADYKMSGDGSPFAQSIPSRITVRVRGAKLYDPRRDSTVGGSGSMRATDQTTWAWVSDDVGRNPALQLLWYLLGWRIQNPVTGTWKLAVGLGLPVARIDLASFMAAANLCDESVALAAGGTEPRYRSDGVLSEGDDPSLVFENLLSAMNGVLRDAGGKLVLDILHNDLGSPVVDLTADDVIGAFTWLQTPPIDQSFNTVRGQYVDASDTGLYQMVDYPDVTLTSADGIDRAKTFNFALVQSASQAQRLAKTYLQRAQYPGTFTADFLASAWRCQVGSVVRLTFPALGFSTKLFRVVQHGISPSGICPMVLREEDASIYAWDRSESAAVTAHAPVFYNPLNDPVLVAIGDAAGSANWSGIAGTSGQPTGTDVAGTVQSGGGVAVNRVTTTAMVNNAVSALATSTCWSTVSGAGVGTWQDICSVTVTPDSASSVYEVIVSFDLHNGNPVGGGLDVTRFQVDGGGIGNKYTITASADLHSYTFVGTVTGFTGTRTMTFQMDGATYMGVQPDAVLSVLEVKK